MSRFFRIRPLRLREKLYLAILPVVLTSLALMSKCTADREAALRYQNEASLILVETLDGIEKLLDDPLRDLLTLSRAADFHDAIFWERSHLDAEAQERSGDLRRFLNGFLAKAPHYRAVAYLSARRPRAESGAARAAEGPWSVSVLKCVPSPPCGAGSAFSDALLASAREVLAQPGTVEWAPRLASDGAQRFVRYAAPVDEREPGAAGGEVGVLVLDLDLEAIAGEIERGRKDSRAVVSLLDRQGAVLRASGVPGAPVETAAALLGRPLAELEPLLAPIHPGSAVRAGHPRDRALALTDLDREPPRIQELGWTLALAMPPSPRLFAGTLVPGNIYLFTGVLAIVVSALCLWGVGWATRPLSNLAEAMGRTGEGDLRAEVAEGPADEIGRLARAFNDMVRALRGSRLELASQLDETRRLKTTLENVIESTPAAVIVLDRGGRVQHWNQAAERQTGRSRAEALGRDIFTLDAAFACHRDAFEQVLREGEAVSSAREEYGLASGERGIRRITIFPVRGDEVRGAVVSSEDVTAEDRIERMMVHAEKMAMIGRLAANMAHEIKNPLAGILWNLHNLERRLHPSSPVARGRMEEAGLDAAAIERFERFLDQQKIPHYVSVIRECGLRADGIVKTLGDFSARGEKLVDVRVRTLVDSTLMLAHAAFDLDKRFDFRDIEVEVDVADGTLLVHGNMQRLEQVLLNLVNNAAQALFARRQEDVRFRPRLWCRAGESGGVVRIEIEDNGPGIPVAAREHIFEPFFTTKDVGEGTGLGLSISYLIVTEGHNGRMWIEDGAAGGARFVIELPSGAEAAASTTATLAVAG